MTVASVVVGALGVGLLVPARSRPQLLAGLALVALALVGTAAAFAAEAGGGELALDLSTGTIAGGSAALALVVAGAAVLVRCPAAVVPLLLVAAPLRPPLDPDPAAPFLVTLRPDALVGYHLPLYAVLAAGALALAWRVARGACPRALPWRVTVPAAALIALATLSVLWSADREEGINDVLVFWLPFAVLFAVVAHARLREWTPRALAWVGAGLGVAFALVGLGQAIAGENFFSTPALAQANATTDLFRVTSLFQDPSIYGRHLVVAMAVVLVALWVTGLRVATGLAVLTVLAAGLFFTYSQSSLIALVAGALVVALVAGGTRVRRLVGGLAAAVAMLALVALVVALASGAAGDLTRSRSTLVEDTVLVFANHPVAGVGVGGQPAATVAEAGGGRSLGQSTSHSTPLTVAAELGALGLAAYLALLWGTFLVLRGLHRREPVLALGLGAVLTVLFVHALIYEGFFETGMSFGAIALACAAWRGGGDEGTASAAAGRTRPAKVSAT